MAEVFKATEAGETAQHFVQFVMMYQQQIQHALARAAGAPGSNLALARAFIQHLVAIRTRSQGNLSREEENVLNNAIAAVEQQFQETARPA